MKLHLLEHDDFDFSKTNISFWAAENGHTIEHTFLCNGQSLPDLDNLDWLLVMGGSPHAYDDESNPWLPGEKALVAEALERGVPTLGICFGAQVIAEVLGGDIFKAEYRELGWHEVELTPEGRDSPVFEGIPESFLTFHWHEDRFSMPPGCVRLARSEATPNQAFMSREKPVVGFQFHPEYTLEMVNTFARDYSDDWTPDTYARSGDQVLERTKSVPRTYWLLEKLLTNLARILGK